MKTRVLLLLLAAAFLITFPAMAHDERCSVSHDGHSVTVHSGNFIDDGVEIDFEDGSIFLTNRFHRGDEVEITRDHELIVNGDKITLSPDEAEMVAAFYDETHELIEQAKEIGLKGARVGVEGAKVGLKAVNGVLKAMFTSYTLDDMERDIEREAAKVEAQAEKLEVEASILEEQAEEVESLYDDMFRDINALRDLEW